MAPQMEGAVDYRIDALNMPWWLVIASMRASQSSPPPARRGGPVERCRASRQSWRCPAGLRDPTPLHRSALLSVALPRRWRRLPVHRWYGTAERVDGPNGADRWSGSLAVLAGVLLDRPARDSRPRHGCALAVPIAARLAFRDLESLPGSIRRRARRRSRWPSASRSPSSPRPRRPRTTTDAATCRPARCSCVAPRSTVPFVPTPATIRQDATGVDAIAASLARLDRRSVWTSPSTRRLMNRGARTARRRSRSRAVTIKGGPTSGWCYVASPELLALFGLDADVSRRRRHLTNLNGSDLDIMDSGGPSRDTGPLRTPRCAELAAGQLHLAATSSCRPEPLAARGWESVPSGQWLIQTDDATHVEPN